MPASVTARPSSSRRPSAYHVPLSPWRAPFSLQAGAAGRAMLGSCMALLAGDPGWTALTTLDDLLPLIKNTRPPRYITRRARLPAPPSPPASTLLDHLSVLTVPLQRGCRHGSGHCPRLQRAACKDSPSGGPDASMGPLRALVACATQSLRAVSCCALFRLEPRALLALLVPIAACTAACTDCCLHFSACTS